MFPPDHLVRQIDVFLDLSWVHKELAPYYSHTGRPSIDPGLMIRMLLVGYVFAIRSERRLCSEVQVNLAYRWFCKLGIEDNIPDHSVFCRARHERFRESEAFGTLKMRMGATHFLMRRLRKVATEMALHVLAYNLTRVMNIMGIQPLMAAIQAQSKPENAARVAPPTSSRALQQSVLTRPRPIAEVATYGSFFGTGRACLSEKINLSVTQLPRGRSAVSRSIATTPR